MKQFYTCISDDVFDQFAQVEVPAEAHALSNYCTECKLPMELAGTEYLCPTCGVVEIIDVDSYKNHEDTVTGSLRITTGQNKGRFYNVTGDYTKTQRKMIHTQLIHHSSKYAGPAIPLNVLNATADQYNKIQKLVTEDDYDENGEICGQKKFVRRGNVKDEILAALLYFECIREGLVRKKRDIANFMGLTTSGFSRGENILYSLDLEGKLELPKDINPAAGFADRYLEALGLEDPRYLKFVVALVGESEKKNIGMNSQISSKTVGAIWVLINKCKLNITSLALEKAADNTKKNTFAKFYNIVVGNMSIFAHVFAEHGIPR